MRRGLLLVAVVVTVSFLPSPALDAQTPTPGQPSAPPRMMAGQQPAKGTAVLKGTVVAADTGAPIRRVLVRAMANEIQDVKAATTDDQGRFEIIELVGGRYTITAQKGGYVTLSYGQRRPSERGTPVEVGPGQTVEKLAFALPRGGVISGRISDEFGDPLAEATVRVERYRYTTGGRRLMPAGRGDTTDDQGSFRLYGLEPGEYVVSATLRNMNMMIVGGRPAPDSDQGYAPTYYPGTPSQGEAQRVSVSAGQEVSGVSFSLMPTRVARLSGRVVGAKSDGVDGFVMVRSADGSMTSMMPGGMVQPDGTFELIGVPPGRYLLQVQSRGRGPDDLIGMTPVTVAGADLQNLTITMQPPGVLSGRVEFEGGMPSGVSPAMVRVFPTPLDPMSGRSIMSGPPQTAADLTFTARGAMGPVVVRTSPPPGWYLKGVFYGGEDVTDTPVRLDPGTKVEGLRVVLTQTATTLAGAVRDQRGSAVVDATVVVFPTDDDRWMSSSRFIRSTRPDTPGRYEFRGLPPYGAYRVIALQGLEDGQMYDPEFLTGARDRADRLTLTEGEAKTLDLRLRQ